MRPARRGGSESFNAASSASSPSRLPISHRPACLGCALSFSCLAGRPDLLSLQATSSPRRLSTFSDRSYPPPRITPLATQRQEELLARRSRYRPSQGQLDQNRQAEGNMGFLRLLVRFGGLFVSCFVVWLVGTSRF